MNFNTSQSVQFIYSLVTGWSGLVVIITGAVIIGIYTNWAWLVAIGLAPVVLSVLPCLIMCAFGVCVACRKDKGKQ